MRRVFRVMSAYCGILGFRALLYWIIGKLANTAFCYTVKREELSHPFQVRIPSSDLHVYRQVFINQEYGFLTASAPEVIVDAGANIGLSSLYFAQKYPEAKIIAIEPEQGNYELLTSNIRPYPNIIAVQAALWHRNEEVILVDPGVGEWGFRIEEKNYGKNYPAQ